MQTEANEQSRQSAGIMGRVSSMTYVLGVVAILAVLWFGGLGSRSGFVALSEFHIALR